MNERRRATRQKSFLRGCIYFNNRRSALDCLVRDISSTGARVIFSGSVQTPDVVELYIPQKEQTLRAQVQWRHGEEMGLAFTQAAAAPDGQPAESGDLTERVARLEAEIAMLKKMLRRMKAEAGPEADVA